MIKIGIIGAPNKGKSTFFSAITKQQVAIADYPFTTISPNVAIAFVPTKCVCLELGVKCSTQYCDGEYRYLPVEVVDVAGLVKDAYLGRGMGNRFLDDLIKADGFIQVIDASGQTDLEGKKTQDFPIEEEIGFLKNELIHWLKAIILRGYQKYKLKKLENMQKELSGLKISAEELKHALLEVGLNPERIELDEKKAFRLASIIINTKPMLIAANKADKGGVMERIQKFKEKNKDIPLIASSAEYEYSLALAAKKGLIEYNYAKNSIKILEGLSSEQKRAIEQIKEYIKANNGTGVWEVLKQLIFEKMKMITAYPVEDENKYCDSKGRVLPDAFLIKSGTKLIDFATLVHSDFANYFVGAIDAKTKKNLSKEYIIKDKDVIKLIAAKR
ncbi:MAG: YchF-related putative GTPase [Candidatus Micrarchaeota archaeon]|nr:YchF-related putative GTPase [Candidatus Micrarchaeota archaeon]